jgi:pyrroline-5-carboxylate reductase
VEGALDAGMVKPSAIFFTRKDKEKAKITEDNLGIRYAELADIASRCDYIFLSVKPQQFHDITEYLRPVLSKKCCIVSIMAGLSIQTIKTALGDRPVARVMPNTPAMLGEGATAISFDSGYQRPQKAFILSFFQSIGRVVDIPESAQVAATAISGCGPAFFYYLADAICQEGVENGLTYDQALTLCAQTFIGAGSMLLEAGKAPAELIRDVASPNGATEAGLKQLQTLNADDVIRTVIRTALQRAIELGQIKETQ